MDEIKINFPNEELISYVIDLLALIIISMFAGLGYYLGLSSDIPYIWSLIIGLIFALVSFLFLEHLLKSHFTLRQIIGMKKEKKKNG